MNAMYDRYPSVPPPPHRDWHDHETPEYRWRYANERCITRAQRDWDVHSAVMVMLNEYGARFTKAFAGLAAEYSRTDAEEKTALNNWTKETFQESEVERDPSGCFTSSGGSGATYGSSGASDARGAALPAGSSASGTQGRVGVGSGATASASASGAKARRSTGGGTDSATAGASSGEYQQLKREAAAYGQTMPDESKLQSESLTERGNTFKDILRIADELEAKNPALARKLRERGKEAVTASYSVVNSHTLDNSRNRIRRYRDGDLDISQFDGLPVNEKLSVLAVLQGEGRLANEKDELFRRLTDNLSYSKEIENAYRAEDWEKYLELRRLAMPREYERETSRKMKGLAKAVAGNSSFQADKVNWETMDRKEKQATLSHWLEFIRKELDLKGKYEFQWVQGPGNMHVTPQLGNEKDASQSIKLYVDELINVPEDAMRELESGSLQEALFAVVHEAMHIHEAETMDKVLKNKDASMEEKLYSLKIACSTMSLRPETWEKYLSHLPESSAMHFSEQFEDAL